MLIERYIASAMQNMLTKFPILLVTGPRQSGKTTLLRHLFPDYRYVNLEQADNRAFATEDPQGFLRRVQVPEEDYKELATLDGCIRNSIH